jgi:transcriptional regulator GlxA family with amidase domain
MMLGILLSNIRRGGTVRDAPPELKAAGLAPRSLDEDFRRAFLSAIRHSPLDPRRLASWIDLLLDIVLHDCLPEPGDATEDTGPADITRTERIVSKLIRFIDANIGGDLSMERLESIGSLSSRQIQRLFTDSVGVSCHQYIMSRRLEVAREKLTVDSSASVKEVAYSCGFSSPAHFATNFKKAYGVSPSNFAL